ncbi:MAG TPA: serine hydrolase [Pelolinea sp.]|nr:serine hydrolase [Pelolinea sp.]
MKISRFNLFRWISIALLVSAVILLVLQLIQFSRIHGGFPPGTQIGGIAVGGLNQQQAAERVTQAFNNPIELVYKDQLFQIKPSQLGFELDIEAMIAAADQQRVSLPFWPSFWDYLWNRPPVSHDTPLRSSIDDNRVRIFLMDEIASRYDKVPQSSQPIPGTINFQYGDPGVVLSVERSLANVKQALQSPHERSVELVINEVQPPRPSLENLEILIRQIIDRSNFDGLTEIYILDLENREEINFAYEQGVDYDPGIAFTAASTIKIPILVSTFKRLSEPTPQGASDLMQQMIEKSENPPADQLMEIYLDPNIGPIFITQDMQEIGLKNTFLAGHFYLGAPLLQRYLTQANQRLDYTTDPDIYNQTTTAELGMLLDDIYQCAQSGGGSLSAVFQNQLSQSECQLMITYLTQNKIAVLMQAGLPDGTQFAHKHGWIVELDGVIHTIMDAGIVFSPGGNYVGVIAMYQPTQLIFDIANFLSAQISTAIYHYFNIQ